MVGDIGAKFSQTMNGTDNGYLMFDHVRIPRDQMLMGLAKVKNKLAIAQLIGKFYDWTYAGSLSQFWYSFYDKLVHEFWLPVTLSGVRI